MNFLQTYSLSLGTLFFRIVYPVYRSLRVYRGKENPIYRLPILKFWAINSVLLVLDTYCATLMNRAISFYPWVSLVLYVALVVGNFKFSIFVYDSAVQPLLDQCEDIIET